VFNLLRTLPNDGTFNQEAAFERAIQKCKAAGCAFGYDLSAATDRLPIALQTAIMASWFGQEEANLWAKVLVDRDYRVKPEGTPPEVKEGLYRYTVGQPMGAYSSWGMLAVTHHWIVQWAYHLAYPLRKAEWFDGYELLGDDIVIFDKAVATKYLEIMTSLGVDINLNKSVVSDPGKVVEFAKRTGVGDQDVSAISLKMIMAAKSIKEFTQVALYLSLKTGLSVRNYFSALASLGPSMLYKQKVDAKINRRYLNLLSRILLQLVDKKGTNLAAIISLFIDTDNPSVWFNRETLEINPGLAESLVQKLVSGKESFLIPSMVQQIYFKDQSIFVRDSLVIGITMKAKRALSKMDFIKANLAKVMLHSWFSSHDNILSNGDNSGLV